MNDAVLPTYYIPHGGGPCFFMDWSPADTWDGMGAFLRRLGDGVGVRPKAIVSVSAHWESETVALMTNPKPPLLFDYYGFPEHTYRLRYDAPGSPALAERIADLLGGAGIATARDPVRGFDHGTFVPFLLIYPEADIPIVQLSLQSDLDPDEHLYIGRAIAPLRREGVLIVGSGMSYHNLRLFGPTGGPASDRFDAWLNEVVTHPDPTVRDAMLRDWEAAPNARTVHPREEHLLPLMVAAGAAGDDLGERIYGERVMGLTVSAYRFGRPARLDS